MLRLASGEERAGADLRELVEEARVDRPRPQRHPLALRPRGGRAGGDRRRAQPAILGDTEKAEAAAAYVARRLDALADETERGWAGDFSPETGFRFEREVRGVKEVAIIDPALLDSADARKLDQYAGDAAADLRQARRAPPQGRDRPIHGPRDLFDAVIAAGRKGLACSATKASAR